MISSVVALIIFTSIFSCIRYRMGHFRSTAECEMHREAFMRLTTLFHFLLFSSLISMFILVCGLKHKDRGWPFAVSSNVRYL